MPTADARRATRDGVGLAVAAERAAVHSAAAGAAAMRAFGVLLDKPKSA